jgi:hypothetical protein
MEQRATVTLYPRNTAFWLCAITIFLLGVHLISILMVYTIGPQNVLVRRIYDLFFPDSEWNIPTLFSTCLFLINAVLFWIVWKAKRVAGEPRRIWLFLAGLFVFLAIDEFVALHEMFIDPLRNAFDASGFFYYTWIIPYGIAVVLLALFMIPVWLRMEKMIRFWFALSAVVYLSGAIGLEMVGGKYYEMMRMKKSLGYVFISTFEESLEMAGLIILTYVLLLLVRNHYNGFLIFIAGTQDAPPQTNQ